MDGRDAAAAGLQRAAGCLVAAVPPTLAPEELAALRERVLEAAARVRPRGVVLDAAAVEVMDREDFEDLVRTIRMVELLGVEVVVAGLAPGVVASLAALGAPLGEVRGALSLEEALAAVGTFPGSP